MKNRNVQKNSAAVLTVFGLITLFLSTSIFFDLFGVRAMEGNYVIFVVIANFIASLLYLFAGVGFWTEKLWTTNVLVVSAGILLIAFMAFSVYVFTGGLHEQKTFGALIFRSVFTLVFVVISFFSIKKLN
jgi:hypothetical protein